MKLPASPFKEVNVIDTVMEEAGGILIGLGFVLRANPRAITFTVTEWDSLPLVPVTTKE